MERGVLLYKLLCFYWRSVLPVGEGRARAFSNPVHPGKALSPFIHQRRGQLSFGSLARV